MNDDDTDLEGIRLAHGVKLAGVSVSVKDLLRDVQDSVDRLHPDYEDPRGRRVRSVQYSPLRFSILGQDNALLELGGAFSEFNVAHIPDACTQFIIRFGHNGTAYNVLREGRVFRTTEPVERFFIDTEPSLGTSGTGDAIIHLGKTRTSDWRPSIRYPMDVRTRDPVFRILDTGASFPIAFASHTGFRLQGVNGSFAGTPIADIAMWTGISAGFDCRLTWTITPSVGSDIAIPTDSIFLLKAETLGGSQIHAFQSCRVPRVSAEGGGFIYQGSSGWFNSGAAIDITFRVLAALASQFFQISAQLETIPSAVDSEQI